MSNVQKVDFTSRPDLDLYVLSISAFDELQLHKALRATEDEDARIATLVRTYVCDANGAPKFATAEAATEFTKTVKGGVLRKLVKQAQQFNAMSDEAIEEELKN